VQARCQLEPSIQAGIAIARTVDMNAWVFLALVLVALAIGAPFAHVLEMPVRRGYDPALYVTVTHTLYRYFGSVGAVIEVGAVLAAVFWAASEGRAHRPHPGAAGRWWGPRAWCWRTRCSGSSSTR
jgi:hypothetical protein